MLILIPELKKPRTCKNGTKCIAPFIADNFLREKKLGGKKRTTFIKLR